MIRNLLNRTLTVYRPSTADDGRGGQTVAYAQGADIRASVAQPSAAERELAQQFGANLTHVVYTTADADVRRGDELAGTLPSATSGRLRVLDVVSNSRATYLRVECEAVQAK